MRIGERQDGRWQRRLGSILGTAVVAVPLVVAACANSPAPSSTEGLLGTWRLVALESDDGTVVRPTNPDAYTVQFLEDDRLHVQADCNVCNGSFEATTSTLTVDPLLACTLAACPAESLFDAYLAALTTAQTWARDERELLITYNDGTLRFVAE